MANQRARILQFPIRKPRSQPHQREVELRVELRDIAPPIWRLLRLPHSLSLCNLHSLIQTAFGWEDRHLWAFVDRKDRWYAHPALQEEEPHHTIDVDRMAVYHLLKKVGDRCVYVYDFGDNWKHDISVVAVTPVDWPDEMCCLAGERAGPHEDTGGAEAHVRFCRILAAPDHPEHHDLRIWIGEDYHPEAFSARQVNQLLRELRSGSAPTIQG